MTTSRRTTTPLSASPSPLRPPTSRRPTATSRRSTTPTATRATRRPRRSSRRSPRPTRCSPTTPSARSTTRRAACSAPAGCGPTRPPAAAPPRRRSTSATCSAGPAAAAGGGLGDLFGGLFGGSGRRTAQPRRGADITSEVTLDFAEAVEGATVPLRMTTPGPCPTCYGSGAKPGTMPRVCPVCSGTGITSKNVGGFSLADPCRECRGTGRLIDDPCPTCLGEGQVTHRAGHQRPHPGRGG